MLGFLVRRQTASLCKVCYTREYDGCIKDYDFRHKQNKRQVVRNVMVL